MGWWAGNSCDTATGASSQRSTAAWHVIQSPQALLTDGVEEHLMRQLEVGRCRQGRGAAGEQAGMQGVIARDHWGWVHVALHGVIHTAGVACS